MSCGPAERNTAPADGVDSLMRLEGIHHITCITGDAPRNVDFYARVLGLRMVKKTVNQDDPTVYHLFYADELGSAGADLTFFEYPGVPRGRAGARDGAPHHVARRLRGGARLLGRAARRRAASRPSATARGCASPIPRGSGSSWPWSRRPTSRSSPSIRRSPTSSRSRASTACGSTPPRPMRARRSSRGAELRRRSTPPTEWEARGEQRGGFYAYDDRPGGARAWAARGTVHHVAWASPIDEHEAWRERVARGRRAPDARHRPLLLQVDLLPRAERRPLRDRHARPGLHRRRAARDARRGPVAAAELRAPARPAADVLTPLPGPARRLAVRASGCGSDCHALGTPRDRHAHTFARKLDRRGICRGVPRGKSARV